MFDNCINKKCEAIVFMGDRWGEASTPLKVNGILDSYNNEYVVIKTKQGKSYISIKALLVLNVID